MFIPPHFVSGQALSLLKPHHWFSSSKKDKESSTQTNLLLDMDANGSSGSGSNRTPDVVTTTTVPFGENGCTPRISVLLTVRLLMQSKEVGSIIGKNGDQVKMLRDKSQAKINISDGSSQERIVTITGNETTIDKAFSMICEKFEDDLKQRSESATTAVPPITLRLIVPATQCGSIIGKGGSKIKEIRDKTGASIQVASEMLPNASERAVTISGHASAIVLCMQEVCKILLDAPPRGPTIMYKPRPSCNPAIVAQQAAVQAAQQNNVASSYMQQDMSAIIALQNQQAGLVSLQHHHQAATSQASSVNVSVASSQAVMDPNQAYYLQQAMAGPLLYANGGMLGASCGSGGYDEKSGQGAGLGNANEAYANYVLNNMYGTPRQTTLPTPETQQKRKASPGTNYGGAIKKKYTPY
uniref:KH domain-containing protein n=1 Tax=Rhabditophanes sp. KR3021 TaxID=114890 RepID=A0AC35U963_9BILA